MTTEIATLGPEEHDEVQMHRSLESRALKGTYYVVIFTGLALALRLLSSVILSRMFAPDYFGLMALVTTLIVGLNLFSHIGLQDSIIQNPRGDEPLFLNTTWTLQALRGLGIWILTILLAWPVAKFYNEPRMLWLMPILGFGCVVSGVSSPSLLTLSRHIGVGRLSLLELVAQFVQFAVTVVWALYQPSIAALLAGRIVSEIVRTVISYSMMPELRPSLVWDKSSVQALFHFGRWILIGTALNFLALQSDRLILGKLITLRMLGIYGIAFSLSDIPRQIILQFCSRVGYPFIAKFADRPRPEYRSIFLKYRALALAAGAMLLVLVICTGDLFIIRVYDKRYHEAAWMIAIFAVGLWHTLLYSTITPAILSLQKPHYNAIANLVYCATLFTSLPVGYHMLGMVGAVLAVALADLPVYFVNLYSAHREGVGVVVEDILLTIGFAALLVAALALRAEFGFGLPFPKFH